ncbi:O-antigen ligase family protein [Neoroseomonas oryzicola]|uniref:O-antigen ligase family protein n=1 Tax=Neoroseomonas oryzicola TaxID=535904 RepID=A0A9X9WP67_9PROT|nr:O-antigen ligase family protein [Neoroseomonas oryzicola]MBR0662127.1 O-antigen ligase family protein [Neoroseomonas oryzicola]NKE20248.1 O-antigen ligase family protein [Neoroseomonas oryzicola]
MSAHLPPALDGAAIPRRRLLSAETVGFGVLVAIILLSNGWAVFSVMSGSIDVADGGDAESGDMLRQVAFLTLMVLAVGVRVVTSSVGAVNAVPPMLIAILAWCWLSVFWAIDPGLALRRIAFTTIVIVTIGQCVQMMSYRRVIEALMVGFAVILLADWLAITLLQHAVHQPGRFDDALIGDWRGIHDGKNEAGAFCALAFILFLHEAIRQRSLMSGAALVVLAAVFLGQTHSKTSMAMVAAALAVGFLVQAGYGSPRAKQAVLLLGGGILLAALIAFRDDIAREFVWMVADPASLTGRVQIWPALMTFVGDHPLLGSGYGSFWGIGAESPIQSYGSGWIIEIFSAHNGYLDILVQTGGIGLAVALLCLVVLPMHVLLNAPLAPGTSRSLICALLVFGWLRDLLESSLLDRANATWVVMVVMYCLLRRTAMPRQRAGGHASVAGPSPEPV